MELLQDKILEEALALKDEMIKNRRHLHEHPELGMDLKQTQAYVEERLKEMGYADVKRVGQAGLTVTVGQGTGKTILLRADMDALPILEDNELPYKSKIDGRMHACGHDMHTTMLLAAAKILKKYEQEIPGTVKLMFQPGEETMEGAKDMVAAGILENPRPDAGVMIHVMPGMPFDPGALTVTGAGPSMASVDWFKITVTGTGGHGSMPYLAVDPIVPMTAIHSGLSAIQSRELPPNAVVAVTVGEISGGVTSNVIPGEMVMGGTIRTYDEKHRQFIKERMTEIVTHIAKAFRCEGTVEFPAGAPFFDSSKELSEHIQKVLPAYVGADKALPVFDSDVPAMGSEDFAVISQEIPACVMILAASDARKGQTYGVHHPKLILDEDALPYGAAAYAGVALSWLAANQ